MKACFFFCSTGKESGCVKQFVLRDLFLGCSPSFGYYCRKVRRCTKGSRGVALLGVPCAITARVEGAGTYLLDELPQLLAVTLARALSFDVCHCRERFSRFVVHIFSRRVYVDPRPRLSALLA